MLGSLWSVDDDATANFMHGFTPTCLERMPAAKRELLHSYYAWAGTEKIAHHRQMADKLGCRQMRYETGCFGARAGQSASRHIAMPATGWEEMLVRMQRLNFVRIQRR